MSQRRPLSPMRRLAIFEAAAGRCHICEQRIVGKGWDVEHRIPLALGGSDDEANMAPAHKTCHALKTAVDFGSIAKAKRVKVKHIGARQSRNPMPGSKASKWKKKMDGTVERRP